jgi:hypothetical protein
LPDCRNPAAPNEPPDLRKRPGLCGSVACSTGAAVWPARARAASGICPQAGSLSHPCFRMPSLPQSQAFFPCGSHSSPDPGLCLVVLFQNANAGNLLARMMDRGCEPVLFALAFRINLINLVRLLNAR